MATATSVQTNIPHTKTTGPCVMVIFGATGDLTKRKLLPSIYNLLSTGLLSREFAIVGMSKDDWSTDQFRKHVSDSLKQFTEGSDPELVDWLERHSYYVQGEFGDSEAYKRLRAQLKEVDDVHGTHGNYFFYFAISPQFFATAVQKLGVILLVESNHAAFEQTIDFKHGHRQRSVCGVATTRSR